MLAGSRYITSLTNDAREERVEDNRNERNCNNVVRKDQEGGYSSLYPETDVHDPFAAARRSSREPGVEIVHRLVVLVLVQNVVVLLSKLKVLVIRDVISLSSKLSSKP